MTKRERVVLRIDAQAHSVEGKLLGYVKDDPALSSREAMMRALKAFYLPWVLEGERSEAEVRAIAKTAIEELEYRVFQIKQRFLSDLEISSTGFAPASNQHDVLPSREDILTGLPIMTTLAEMMQEVDGLGSQQYLDDF